MNFKKLTLAIVIIVFGFFIYVGYILYFKKPLSNDLRPSFKEWYSKNSKDLSPVISENKIKVIDSPLMKIDGIFRSMEGPSSTIETYLTNDWPGNIKSIVSPKLLWLLGYSVELYNEKDEKISEEFMCHNNLNISIKDILPWKIYSQGTDKRLFTLTEGQTSLSMPDGCGIPILSNQKLRIDFQVLNHNQKNINIKVKQRVKLIYKEASFAENFIPLYQQTVFVTKQISGPKGEYNTKPNADSSVIFSNEKQQVCCGNTFGTDVTRYNPFNDIFGRIYTGHWEINDGKEIINTNVSQMLNLIKDTKVYFISVHVHPFCEQLNLINAANSDTLYKAIVSNMKDKIGLQTISYYRNSKGIDLKKNDPYYLQSVYTKSNTERHTAMATMLLYIEEN